MSSLCLILYLITIKLNLKYKKLSLEVSYIRVYGSRYHINLNIICEIIKNHLLHINVCIHVYLQIWQREEYTIIDTIQSGEFILSFRSRWKK